MSLSNERKLREAIDLLKLAIWMLALQSPIIVVAFILSPRWATGWPL